MVRTLSDDGTVVEEIASQYSKTVKVGKLDIDQDSEIAARYSVMSVPTFLVFKDGEVKGKVIGAVPKEELERLIDQAK